MGQVIQMPTRKVCPGCGALASCDCGLAPIERIVKATVAAPGRSISAVAKETGTDRRTVAKIIKKGEHDAHPEKVIGSDGKSYPASGGKVKNEDPTKAQNFRQTSGIVLEALKLVARMSAPQRLRFMAHLALAYPAKKGREK